MKFGDVDEEEEEEWKEEEEKRKKEREEMMEREKRKKEREEMMEREKEKKENEKKEKNDDEVTVNKALTWYGNKWEMDRGRMKEMVREGRQKDEGRPYAETWVSEDGRMNEGGGRRKGGEGRGEGKEQGRGSFVLDAERDGEPSRKRARILGKEFNQESNENHVQTRGKPGIIRPLIGWRVCSALSFSWISC